MKHAIRHNHSPEKQARAAERLREAKFAAFKARLDANKDKDLDKAIAKWKLMTTDEIISEYSKGEA